MPPGHFLILKSMVNLNSIQKRFKTKQRQKNAIGSLLYIYVYSFTDQSATTMNTPK